MTSLSPLQIHSLPLRGLYRAVMAIALIAAVGCGGEDTAVEGQPVADTSAGVDGGGGLDGQGVEACTEDADCTDGRCIWGRDGRVCAQTCGADAPCPSGTVCAKEGDGDEVCVDEQRSHCAPCMSDDDCGPGGGRCLQADNNAGSFCAAPCGAGCPDGSTCADIGDGAKGCVPTEGLCTCSPWASAVEASTSCASSSPAGSCPGKRSCGADGLSVCDAPPASSELCDGADNDATARRMKRSSRSCTNSNDVGSCSGQEVCMDGKLTCGAPELPKRSATAWTTTQRRYDEGSVDTDKDGTVDCADDDDDNDGVKDGETTAR